MTLNPVPSYPSTLCYVLRLHRDSQPACGRISGRLEHVATGETMPFEDAAALLTALAAHVRGGEASGVSRDT